MEYKSSGATTADEEELKQEESDSDYKGDESANSGTGTEKTPVDSSEFVGFFHVKFSR